MLKGNSNEFATYLEKETVENQKLNPMNSFKNVNLNFNVNLNQKKPQSIKKRENQIKAMQTIDLTYNNIFSAQLRSMQVGEPYKPKKKKN